MNVDEILEMAESCAKSQNLVLGTWYVAKTLSKKRTLTGHFLLIPDATGDRLVMINIKDCSVHLAHMTLFKDIHIVGVVREGKKSKKIWETK